MSLNDIPPTDPEHDAPPPPDDLNERDWTTDEQMRVDLASGVVHDNEEVPRAPWEPEPDLLVLLTESVEEVRKTVGVLQETVELHQGKIDDLDEMLQAVPDGPWAWHALNTPERKKLWDRLYRWVTWLEDRYLRNLSGSRTGVFPADWYRHPVAVELLTALMIAHAAAYRRKASAPSFVLVEWHERCLWPTIDRMQKLGLFPSNTESANWDGPDLRPTRRDDDRFGGFVTADLAAQNHVDDAEDHTPGD